MLALSLRSIADITSGYAEARPLGESGPNAHDRKGSLSATFLRTSLPVVMLALSLRSIADITTGYAEARPLGESGPKTSPKTG